MIERFLAWLLFTALLCVPLFLSVALLGFEATVIIALAGIAVLAADTGR